MTLVLMFRLMLRSMEPIAGLEAQTYGLLLVSTQGGYYHSIFLCKIFLRSLRIISYLCLICSIISFENMQSASTFSSLYRQMVSEITTMVCFRFGFDSNKISSPNQDPCPTIHIVDFASFILHSPERMKYIELSSLGMTCPFVYLTSFNEYQSCSYIDFGRFVVFGIFFLIKLIFDLTSWRTFIPMILRKSQACIAMSLTSVFVTAVRDLPSR